MMKYPLSSICYHQIVEGGAMPMTDFFVNSITLFQKSYVLSHIYVLTETSWVWSSLRDWAQEPPNHEISQVPEEAVSPHASQPSRAILCPPGASVFHSEFQLPLGGVAAFLVVQISQSPTYQYAIKLCLYYSVSKREICHGGFKLRSQCFQFLIGGGGGGGVGSWGRHTKVKLKETTVGVRAGQQGGDAPA